MQLYGTNFRFYLDKLCCKIEYLLYFINEIALNMQSILKSFSKCSIFSIFLPFFKTMIWILWQKFFWQLFLDLASNSIHIQALYIKMQRILCEINLLPAVIYKKCSPLANLWIYFPVVPSFGHLWDYYSWKMAKGCQVGVAVAISWFLHALSY